LEGGDWECGDRGSLGNGDVEIEEEEGGEEGSTVGEIKREVERAKDVSAGSELKARAKL